MSKKEEALKMFNGNYNCSQSVISVFAEDLGISKEIAMKIASGFGAGMAHRQLSCGAVTAANMVIGLKFGNYIDGDVYSKQRTYQLAAKFMNEFEIIHKSLECRKLTECDFSTEQGFTDFKEKNIQEKVCSECIKTSIEILDKILSEND